MRALIFLILFIPFLLLLLAGLHEPPEHLKTEKEKTVDLLEDFTFNTPKEITVLFNEDRIDQKTREKYKTLILKTNEEYLPKSPRIPHETQAVLTSLKTKLSDYNFGEPAAKSKANFFRWLSTNSEWTVSSLKTSQGYYSYWQRKTDVHQLTREE